MEFRWFPVEFRWISAYVHGHKHVVFPLFCPPEFRGIPQMKRQTQTPARRLRRPLLERSRPQLVRQPLIRYRSSGLQRTL
jgi:hypothetical protein